MEIIKREDPRHAAAQKVIDAMYEYWQLSYGTEDSCAVRWIQDANGKVVIFTRGEYRDVLMQSVGDIHNNQNPRPTKMFEPERLEGLPEQEQEYQEH